MLPWSWVEASSRREPVAWSVAPLPKSGDAVVRSANALAPTPLPTRPAAVRP